MGEADSMTEVEAEADSMTEVVEADSAEQEEVVTALEVEVVVSPNVAFRKLNSSNRNYPSICNPRRRRNLLSPSHLWRLHLSSPAKTKQWPRQGLKRRRERKKKRNWQSKRQPKRLLRK